MSINKIFSNNSPDARRTLVFVAVAGVCLAITGIVEWYGRPREITEFGRMGQEFYPDFTDPTRATALEVYAIDTENVRPREFRVEQLPNGRWVIPSHHNYPADAEEQLAKTAASIIGIEREAMVTRWEADHGEFKVVDPKQEAFQPGDVEGVGERIILRGEDGVVLADYIIGRTADTAGRTEQDQYYVRRPDEDEVYIARLTVDLSTKFVDWVDTELLDVEAMDVREITVNDYSFDEMQGRVTNREISTLRRESSADPWGLENLDDETMEVDDEALRETVNTVSGLEMVGVRPKQEGLTPQLKLDRDALKSQNDVNRLQRDLMSKGFVLQPGESGDPDDLRLLAREGEMAVAASDGLYYQLHFGRAFAGSQEELEIGFASSEDELAGSKDDEGATSEQEAGGDEADSEDAKQDDSEANGEAEGDTAAEGEGEDEDAESDSGKPGRYVFLRVEFDKAYLGDEPVKPVEPQEPEELKEAAEPKEEDSGQIKTDNASSEEAANEENDSDGSDDDASAEESDDGAAEGDEEGAKDEETAKEDPQAKALAEYQEAKQEYEDKLKEYETDLQEYNEQIEEGKEKAEKLNRRFADWYYVIPGESYEKLRLSRPDLIKEKEEDEEDEGAAGAGKMPGGFPGGALPQNMPGLKKALKPAPDAPGDAETAPKSVAPPADAPGKEATAKEPAAKEATADEVPPAAEPEAAEKEPRPAEEETQPASKTAKKEAESAKKEPAAEKTPSSSPPPEEPAAKEKAPAAEAQTQ